MNTLRTQLQIIFTAVLFLVFALPSVSAAEGLISVDFHGNTPLFAEGNILPGDGVTRPVTVENISEQTQDVYLQLLDGYQTKGLADALELRIVKSGGALVLGPVPLSDLFGGVQAPLSGALSSGESVTYDVTIAFAEDAGNEYQEGEAGFDFCIGFSGGDIGCDGQGGNGGGDGDDDNGGDDNGGDGDDTDGGGSCANCGGDGDGNGNNGNNNNNNNDNDNNNNGVGGSLENLIITNESAENVDDGDGSADLTWSTNKPATSKVVCGPLSDAPYNLTLSENNFGYPWGSAETSSEVTDHIVSLIGLDPGTYLCRVASREAGDDNWTVSDDFAFTITQASGAETPASFIGVGNTPVAFAQEQEGDEPLENQEDTTDDDSDDSPSDQVAGVFTSLGDRATDGLCTTQWWIWLLVLVAFLIATIWSREMLTYRTAGQPIKRLYVLGVGGLVMLLVAFVQDMTEWIIPIGVGTVAILVATIVDTVLTTSATFATQRLQRIIVALTATTLVALVLALLFEWLCSIIPLVLITIILIVRYALRKGGYEPDVSTKQE